MYSIDDKDAAVRTVQRYLSLNESGIYDGNTRDAVRSFQSENGLPVTGSVDYATFMALRGAYLLQRISDSASSSAPQLRFPVKEGDSGTGIAALNAGLSEVLSAYTYNEIRPRGSYYNVYTAVAVTRLQEIFGLEQKDGVDEALYVRIERERLTHL